MSISIFVSYSREDKTYVRRLADDLRAHGFDVWMDERIDYGDRWWQTVVQALLDANAVVVVMTPNSEQSEWVEREVQLALRENKPIFPLLLRGRGFPILITTQYVDVTSGGMPPLDFHERLARATTAEGKFGPPAPSLAISAGRTLAEPRRRIRALPIWARIAIVFFGLVLLVGASVGIWSALEPWIVTPTPSPPATRTPTEEPTHGVSATPTAPLTLSPTSEGSGTPTTALTVEPEPTPGTSSSLGHVPEPIVPYDPRFLGQYHKVPLPRLTGASLEAAWNDGEVVDYLHYSLVMNQERGLAIYTAANLDRENARSVPRSIIQRWNIDERLPRAIQRDSHLYLDNDWDRGQLVSETDITWGELASTSPSSFEHAVSFYPNTTPQHKDFNRGLWLALEEWIRDSLEPTAPRVVIFTGPMFRESDLELHSTLIPQTYWKLAVVIDPDNSNYLRVYAYAIGQYTRDSPSEVPVTDVYPGVTRTNFDPTHFQVTVLQIEDWTGLDFDYLRLYDVARER